MERQFIHLDDKTIILINGPLIFFSLTANIFYARCLIFPPCNRQRLKHPLKMLLGLLVWCSTMYSVTFALAYVLFMEPNSFDLFLVSWIILVYYVHTSMTCSVWLNFYYYVQIVPSQQVILIWVKRNIRSVIYMILFLDRMLFWFKGAVNIANVIFPFSFTDINGTWTEIIDHNTELDYVNEFCFIFANVYMLFCLCIMTVSSFSMVYYLQRHERRMAQGGGFSTLRIQSQKRVTITGISQGVFFILYGTFYYLDAMAYRYSHHFYFSFWTCITATSLYISGTTVNLGIGQTIFRQRAADTWKALKALCGVGMVKNDVKVHSSQLTLGVIANTVTDNVQMSL